MIPEHLFWQEHQLDDAFGLLIRFKNLGMTSAGPSTVAGGGPVQEGGRRASLRRLGLRASALGLEAEAEDLLYGDLERSLGALRGALMELRDRPVSRRRFLAVLGSGLRSVRLLAPNGTVHRVPAASLRQELRQSVEGRLPEELDQLLEAAGLPEAGRSKARRGLLRERLGRELCGRVLHVQPSPGSGFLGQVRFAGLTGRLALLAAAHAAHYLLFILGWWLLGRGALSGTLEMGWLWAWGLLLMTLLPLQAMAFWNQGILALGLGALLRRRLLAGALQLDLEEPRNRGAGQLLGRVIEAESVERLALNGGFRGLLFLFEWTLALWVLSLGLGGSILVPLLVTWTLLAFVLGHRFYRRRQGWTRFRVGMTDSMVERMVGHGTRLAQQSRADWHGREDRELADYLQESRRLDAWVPSLASFASRGWVLAALIALIPPLQQAAAGSEVMTGLAISFGGMLLAQRALGRLVDGGLDLAGAAISWQQVRQLFHAAAGGADPGNPQEHGDAASRQDSERQRPLLEARQVGFRYPARAKPVLEGVNLAVRHGDQILLEGASGAGKSTLIALLSGLRSPGQGLLLLHGIDPFGWGSGTWRKRVAVAPQFHENHVFAGSLAFNLLLGREWPPSTDSLERAESICIELGLGPLLERMPGGVLQPVGETGWQLSHGERSRVYIARALLQGAEVVVLDESFAAMDPENLSQCLSAVRRMAPTLVVIAHP